VSDSKTIHRLSWILVPLILLLAGASAWYMIWARPEPERRVPEVVAPLVRVQPVTFETVQLTVASQGTVAPRTESRLVSEVAGRVEWVSPSFVSGGFFEQGEPLVRIDDHDFRQAVVRAEADVTRARLRLAQEEAEAEVARREWEDLGQGEATPLTLRVPQVDDARATLAAAEAALQTARRDLERTEVRAPYVGRVRSKAVDLGQFVTVGTSLGSIYSVDYAEIRLPLPDQDLAFLDLPLVYRGNEGSNPGPKVTLSARFAGGDYSWTGRVVRTEGEIDAQSRLVHVVARVKDPYGRGANPDRPPLAAGMFVQAEIAGRAVPDVAVLPRAALRGTNEMLVVDDEDRLRIRAVDVLRTTSETVIVRGGLEAGERVCLSPLEAVTDGMRVRIYEESTAAGEAEGERS